MEGFTRECVFRSRLARPPRVLYRTQRTVSTPFFFCYLLSRLPYGVA